MITDTKRAAAKAEWPEVLNNCCCCCSNYRCVNYMSSYLTGLLWSQHTYRNMHTDSRTHTHNSCSLLTKTVLDLHLLCITDRQWSQWCRWSSKTVLVNSTNTASPRPSISFPFQQLQLRIYSPLVYFEELEASVVFGCCQRASCQPSHESADIGQSSKYDIKWMQHMTSVQFGFHTWFWGFDL